MNLTFLERRRKRASITVPLISTEGNTLRIMDESVRETGVRSWEPRVIRGGEQSLPLELTGGSVTARAEVKAKRFIGDLVQEDRYAATIAATDGSPHALLVGLSRVFAEIEELRSSLGAEERVILQVSLIL